MALEVWPANVCLNWILITDAVMGGVSCGSMSAEFLGDRPAICMRGDVSTDNNGGFIQIALELAPESSSFDAGDFTGLEIDVCGNCESYGVHLRTTELTRPQQSYRYSFFTTPDWRTLSSLSSSSHPTESTSPSIRRS